MPIGYYTSQGFSNFYLQQFDHEVKQKAKIKHYVRYVDDVVFLDSNKRKLHKARLLLEGTLRKEHLHFKGDWQLWKAYAELKDTLEKIMEGYDFT